VLKIKVGKNMRSTIIKDIQVHPAKRQILHLDLQRIVEDEVIKMTIPLHYLNEEVAPGVKAGGSVSKTMIEVEIECLPKDLPEFIEVDLAAMELDSMLHMSDITLPDGVQILALTSEPPTDEAIVSVHVLRVAAEPEEDEAVEGEEGAEDSTEGKGGDAAGDDAEESSKD